MHAVDSFKITKNVRGTANKKKTMFVFFQNAFLIPVIVSVQS